MNNRVKKIVTTSWHRGGAEAIAPVIKELIQKGHKITVITHGDVSANVFKKNNIPHKTIADYGLKDVSSESMRRLLQDINRPDLVLTGTVDRAGILKDDVIDQTITFVAKQLGIKTLAILDSPRGFSDRFNYLGKKDFRFCPDKIVAEKNVIDAVKNQGVNSKLLEPLGNPSFDILSTIVKNFREDQKQEIREQIGLSDLDFLIFYAGGTYQDQFKKLGYWDYTAIQIISDVMKYFSKKMPEKVGTVVKLHPGMPQLDQESISDIINRSKMKLITDIDLHDLILAADLVITTYSTVGIKAIHMGKLCLSLQPDLKTEDLFIPSALGVIPVAYNKPACWMMLPAMILSSRARNEWLQKASGFRTDGRATERVVELVYKMLS
jgi:hypothetical protein